jgi:hypothetical protein
MAVITLGVTSSALNTVLETPYSLLLAIREITPHNLLLTDKGGVIGITIKGIVRRCSYMTK